MRDEQTHPHRPRLVVSHSTCPPLSSSPHAHSFVIGPAVIKHTRLIHPPLRNCRNKQTRLPSVPDCVKGAEPDVVHCHRCNQPCRNAVVFLHKIYFLKTKKAEKAEKTKTAVKKTVFNFSTDMLLIFWRWTALLQCVSGTRF